MISILMTILIISVTIGYLYYQSMPYVKDNERSYSGFKKCTPDIIQGATTGDTMCAVNINTGKKRCGPDITANLDFEDCTRQNYCDSDALKYSLNKNNSSSPGYCKNCDCVQQSQCSGIISTVFKENRGYFTQRHSTAFPQTPDPFTETCYIQPNFVQNIFLSKCKDPMSCNKQNPCEFGTFAIIDKIYAGCIFSEKKCDTYVEYDTLLNEVSCN